MEGRGLIFLKAVVLCLTFLSGCYRPVEGPVITDWTQAQPAVHTIVVGRSLERRPIECVVLGTGHDVTVIVAAIHGDEPAAVPIVRRLAAHLQENPQLLQGRRAVLVPVANPDGLMQSSRLNARGVDLNRNFPSSNRTNDPTHGQRPLSEPEARIIRQLIRQYHANRIISMHQLTDTGPEALTHRVPKGCIDYDGPGKVLAEKMAQHCDLPVEKLGAAPGSLGSYAGEDLGIPCITVELSLGAELLGSNTLWDRYGAALVAAVMYPEDPQ